MVLRMCWFKNIFDSEVSINSQFFFVEHRWFRFVHRSEPVAALVMTWGPGLLIRHTWRSVRGGSFHSPPVPPIFQETFRWFQAVLVGILIEMNHIIRYAQRYCMVLWHPLEFLLTACLLLNTYCTYPTCQACNPGWKARCTLCCKDTTTWFKQSNPLF